MATLSSVSLPFWPGRKMLPSSLSSGCSGRGPPRHPDLCPRTVAPSHQARYSHSLLASKLMSVSRREHCLREVRVTTHVRRSLTWRTRALQERDGCWSVQVEGNPPQPAPQWPVKGAEALNVPQGRSRGEGPCLAGKEGSLTGSE